MLYSSKIFNKRIGTPPAGVEELHTQAVDGSAVTIWRMRFDGESRKSAALLFHGNGEDLPHFVAVQSWLSLLGVTTYSVEYRGYDGWQSGWPSEEGFYLDADAAYKLLQDEEHLVSEKIMVLGSSIGTGVASHVARKFNVGTLVLLSPYTSLTEVVADLPVFGFLSAFLKYRFPTRELISSLSNTCLVLAHGRKDFTIPYKHSETLKKLYRGTGTVTLVTSEHAGHSDLIRNAYQEISAAIETCLARTAGSPL